MTVVLFFSFILLACERLSDWFRGYSIVLFDNIVLLKKRKELKENKKNEIYFLLISLIYYNTESDELRD